MGRTRILSLLLALFLFLPVEAQKIKVACIGNSITYGAGIANRDQQSYPAQLQYWLGNNYEVRNFGVSGATLLSKGDRPYQNEATYQAALNFLPDIVIIKLGTNDSKPQNWAFKSEFSSDYAALINSFKKLSSQPRILCALPVPVFEKEKWGINQAVVRDEIVPMVKEIATKNNCEIIDLYSTLEKHGRYFPDAVHPDPLGAEIMVKQIYLKLFQLTAANNGKYFNTTTHPVPSPEYRGAAAGWGKGNDWFSQHNAINKIGEDRQVDLVFLGNSITQSWGGAGRDVWSPVKNIWDSLYVPRNAANFGISGDRTQHVLWRIDNGNFDHINPKVIVLAIGVNNFRSNTADEIAAGIKMIVNRLKKKLPDTKILVLGPFATGANPTDPMRIKYQDVHRLIKTIGNQKNVDYMNMGPGLILNDGSLDYNLMRTDNVHFAPEGYRYWAESIEPYLKSVFKD